MIAENMFERGLRYAGIILRNPYFTYTLRYPKPQNWFHDLGSVEKKSYDDLRAEITGDEKFIKNVSDNRRKVLNQQYKMLNQESFMYSVIRKIRPKTCIETGTFDGRSTAAILNALHMNFQEHGVDGHLTSIDLPAYTPVLNSTVEIRDRTTLPPGCEPGWTIPEYLKGRWDIELGDSKEILPKVLSKGGEIDIFIHDSLHTVEHMLFEYDRAWPKLREGGFLISDDIHWNSAFKDFSKEHDRKIHAAYGYGIIKK